MTLTEALKQATRQVRANHYGPNKWQVQHWSEKHRAWWDGQIIDRQRALMAVYEARICAALELLNVDVDHAQATANSCVYSEYPRDWRQVVRDEAKTYKAAEAE